MFGLKPPRHISTLPRAAQKLMSALSPVYPELRTSAGATGMSSEVPTTDSCSATKDDFQWYSRAGGGAIHRIKSDVIAMSRTRVRIALHTNGPLLITGPFVQLDVGAPRIVNKRERHEWGLRVGPIQLDSICLQIIQECL
jgi:hypothetical protein